MITYPDSVQFLYSLGNEIKTAKLGLDRISALLAELGHPEQGRSWIHVAGTNGKGSTCAMIESCLRAAGYRTGLYTSPHLAEPTERIQVGGVEVTRDQFVQAFHSVHEAALRMLDAGGLDAHPTYFETVTAMAFLLFRELDIEVGVMEVGLGGRLDATNVIMPKLAVITPIDFDHENWLGHSIHAIAGEKAGILKPDVPAVFAPQRPEALERLTSVAEARGVEVTHSSEWEALDLSVDENGSRFLAAHAGERIPIACNLAGRHQVQNALTAITALRRFGVEPAAIEAGLPLTRWPGRLEKIAGNPTVIVDGAHNPAGIRTLASYLGEFFASRKIWIVYGSMRDKSVDEIGEILAPLASEIILTMPDSPRALRPEFLQRTFQHARVRVAERLPAALDLVREAGPADLIVFTGSLYIAGEARVRLMRPVAAA